MRTYWIICYCLLCGALPATGQELDTLWVAKQDLGATQSSHGTFIAMRAGVSLAELSALNEQLAQRLYGPVGNNITSIGFSLHRYRHRLVWGMELYNFMTAQSRVNGQSALLQVHYGTLHIGHRLWRNADKQHIYLSGGLGYGGTFTRLRVAQGVDNERFQAGGPLVDVAFHAYHNFILQGRIARISQVGLSIGYLHSVDNAWIMRGLSSSDLGVPVSPQGIYFRLSLGMGSWNQFERQMKVVEREE